MQKTTRVSIIASMVPDEIINEHSDHSVRRYETALMFIDVSGECTFKPHFIYHASTPQLLFINQRVQGLPDNKYYLKIPNTRNNKNYRLLTNRVVSHLLHLQKTTVWMHNYILQVMLHRGL